MCCWREMQRIYAIPSEGKLILPTLHIITTDHAGSDLRGVYWMLELAPMP